VAALLDLAPEPVLATGLLPRGWQFPLLAADTRRSDLRPDGFPGLGVPMPDLGLPRVMLGGRSVEFRRDIPIGSTLRRKSTVRHIAEKTTTSGPMAVVTLAHELHLSDASEAALVETQTYLLLPARVGVAQEPEPLAASRERASHEKTLVPDDTLLFQYSALGFNSHRIHLDRQHAREVEGFPDLVVNGGLSTLLLTEFLRQDLGVVPTSYSVRHLAPLYCNRMLTMTADPAGERWRLRAFDNLNRLAVDMEVTV
jgi:3-methylfumaryl-CoA hydratase